MHGHLGRSKNEMDYSNASLVYCILLFHEVAIISLFLIGLQSLLTVRRHCGKSGQWLLLLLQEFQLHLLHHTH
jgi:hypothetical protein